MTQFVVALTGLVGAIALTIVTFLAFALIRLAFRLVNHPLQRPQPKHWTEILAPVVHGLSKALDYLVAKKRPQIKPGKKSPQKELFPPE